MAETSTLTRYRPAAIAVAGLAAAYGVYILISTGEASIPEKTTLHRSNAVHRPRAPRPKVEVLPPNEEGPLGYIVIRRGHSRVVTNLMSFRLPSEHQIEAVFGSQWAGEVYRRSCVVSIHCIMWECARYLMEEHWGPHDSLPRQLRGAVLSRNRGQCVLLLHGALSTVDLRTIEDAVAECSTLDHDGPLGDVDSDVDSIPELAETENFDVDSTHEAEPSAEPSQGIKGLLYNIAEDNSKREAYEHRGITCEECGEVPIRGLRYHCLNCPDYDLCANCEIQTAHPKTHVFAMIKIPLPVLSQPTQAIPLWYPGDPHKLHPSLGPNVRKHLSREHGFEEHSIDALWDQFTAIANVGWSSEPYQEKDPAIDSRTFVKALSSERWNHRFAPNAVYDRMFAFYDARGDGLINFREFVSGLAYLRGPNRFQPLTRALEGFDLDGDGFVSRGDFLRLFKAKHELDQRLVSDMVEAQEDELLHAASDVLRATSQPISSFFHEEEIPQGEQRPRHGKRPDEHGDMQPLPGTKTILDDEPWPPQPRGGQCNQPHPPAPSAERLRYHLSRFEEMLYRDDTIPETTAAPEVDLSGQDDAVKRLLSDCGEVEMDEFAEPYNTDVLLSIVEEGLNRTLDPMFGPKEAQYRMAEQTRAEREKWRMQIDQYVRGRRQMEEDPLVATAMRSSDHSVKVERRPENAPEPPFCGEIVPTDVETLTRREQEIAQRPLEELLEATGYGTVDNDDQPANALSPKSALAPIGAQQAVSDPTLPQNRPNNYQIHSSTTSQPHSEATGQPYSPEPGLPRSTSGQRESSPPSEERLEWLASFDDVDREALKRGGEARLSFDEIEAIVQADTTGQLRGLVINWLEFASF